MSQVFDTIIIGAGWAGAVAARDLARAGRSVLVLEARDRVGGRARTWSHGDARIDLGCSWIHGYNEGNPARRIAKDMGVVSTPATGSGEDAASWAAAMRAATALGAARRHGRTVHDGLPGLSS